jgi:hypothetical protein
VRAGSNGSRAGTGLAAITATAQSTRAPAIARDRTPCIRTFDDTLMPSCVAQRTHSSRFCVCVAPRGVVWGYHAFNSNLSSVPREPNLMIRVLFIHQNLPGQFRRLMRYLQTRPDDRVVAIGEETAVRREPVGPALRVIGCARPDGPCEKTHHCLRHVEGCVSLDDRLRIRIKNSVSMQSRLADRVLDLIARRHEIAAVGLEGRATVVRRSDVDTVALPVSLDLLKPLAAAVPALAYAEEVA